MQKKRERNGISPENSVEDDKNTSKIIKSGYLRAQKLKSMMLRNRNNGSKLKDSINVKEYIKEAENDYV